MKLRIKGSSIRLRLSQSDLATFARTGRLAEMVDFPSGARLRYGLEATSEAEQLDVAYHGHTLVVHCPRAWIADWMDTDRVGFEATLPVDDGDALHLLVEKDFECLHKSSHAADVFPHPRAPEHNA